MHSKHLFLIDSRDALGAVDYVQQELDTQEYSKKWDYYTVVGVLDLKNDKYHCFDKSSTVFSSIDKTNATINGVMNKSEYDLALKVLKDSLKSKQWDGVEYASKWLGIVQPLIDSKKEFDIKKPVELSNGDYTMFGVSFVDTSNKRPRFMVVVDFHY